MDILSGIVQQQSAAEYNIKLPQRIRRNHHFVYPAGCRSIRRDSSVNKLYVLFQPADAFDAGCRNKLPGICRLAFDGDGQHLGHMFCHKLPDRQSEAGCG
ncbi:hypothetical protein D3C80_1108900 [compost metagenome]